MDGLSTVRLTALAIPVAAALGVLAWRLRETRRALSLRSILLPPAMMSTGLAMFLAPPFRVPWTWALAAFATGALVFAYPLLRSTTLERQDRDVRLRRSRSFLVVLIGLVVIRLVLRDYVDDVISPQQTAGLFFLIALGMILRWRTAMYFQFKALARGARDSD
jgi:membrane protein CcdC involved in cytochrome C biogenesis